MLVALAWITRPGSAQYIQATGDSFTQILRAATDPDYEPPPTPLGRLERARLHSPAINRRMAQLERELSAGELASLHRLADALGDQ